MSRAPEGIHRSLLRLHEEVEAKARGLAAGLAPRLQCRRGCTPCCSDGLSVFEVEAERIRRNAAELLEQAEPHPEGACAFLDSEGACRVYEHRPYVCRTQGLPLRWFEEDEETGEVHDRRDICPLNLEGSPLESLDESACWSIGPTEERLAALQQDLGPRGARIELRSLFRRR